MTTATEPEALLIFRHLHIQNTNAISSPLTWGFPAATAFTGFVHALHRRLAMDLDVTLEGVGIICHHFDAQVSQPAGKRTKVFNLTRNPVGKDGSTSAIVEEGRAHMEVSLVIGVRGAGLYGGDDPQTIADRAWQHALGMRVAGGSVLPPIAPLTKWRKPELVAWPGTFDERRKLSRKLALGLLPGFALVSREALLQQHLDSMREDKPATTTLDALLDLSRLNIEPQLTQHSDTGVTINVTDATPSNGATRTQVEWHIRKKPGWLVPIPVGYTAISPLYAPGKVTNVRDREVPFRFVESIFSLGEWLSPHRIENVCDLLWHHHADPDAGLYRCTTHFFASHISE